MLKRTPGVYVLAIAMRLYKPIPAQLRQMNASKLTVGCWKVHENNLSLRWSRNRKRKRNRRQSSVGDKRKRRPWTKGISRLRDKREKHWHNWRSGNCSRLGTFTDRHVWVFTYTYVFMYTYTIAPVTLNYLPPVLVALWTTYYIYTLLHRMVKWFSSPKSCWQ